MSSFLSFNVSKCNADMIISQKQSPITPSNPLNISSPRVSHSCQLVVPYAHTNAYKML